MIADPHQTSIVLTSTDNGGLVHQQFGDALGIEGGQHAEVCPKTFSHIKSHIKMS